MAFRLHWAGSGVFLATEVRVQLHEWLAILTGTLTPGALIVFVAILAPELLPVTLVGALVYSMFLIGQRVLNEAAYVRIDHGQRVASLRVGHVGDSENAAKFACIVGSSLSL